MSLYQKIPQNIPLYTEINDLNGSSFKFALLPVKNNLMLNEINVNNQSYREGFKRGKKQTK